MAHQEEKNFPRTGSMLQPASMEEVKMLIRQLLGWEVDRGLDGRRAVSADKKSNLFTDILSCEWE